MSINRIRREAQIRNERGTLKTSMEPDDLVFHAVDLVNAVRVHDADSTLTFHDSMDQYKRRII